VTADCLAESTVLAFIGGRLPPETLSSVEEHISACSACADLVTWAAADHGSAVRLAGVEGRPFVGQLQPGARIGRYQILGAVGRGGMGEVHAAYHPDLDRRIAVKVVYGSDVRADQRRVRLLREARAIARLSHPNVITVHDAGTFGDGVFIAMELIDGWTIEQWLRAEARTWQQILDVFIGAARGLAAAHAAGVVHRDFKPQNVMIAKSGAVRVMDFGLARLAQDDGASDGRETPVAGRAVPSVETVTKTGAFIGTPAYMAPEQFRREATDARSDQFSFCVALHEALYGVRPAVAIAEGGAPVDPSAGHSRRTGVPGWLRAIVLRGASAEREQRYPSMDALVAALERGRTPVRRRVWVPVAAFAAIMALAGAWRVAHGSRFACAVPKDRLEAVWSPDDAGDPRRQTIHRAFTASGRNTAETSWARLSKVLDDYVTAWGAMYMQTCEATHVRGEQSSEVLDLRMSCLADNLDQVRALTDALATADATVVPRAVLAATDLTPVTRCADVALLKSAVPLPRDERTLHEVQRLRRELAEAEVMREVGRLRQGLDKAAALKPEVEKAGYRPLIAEQLYQHGVFQSELHLPQAERTLEDAFFAAEGARDDATAAKAASNLTYVVGLDHGRLVDAERWARLATAILDRMPAGTMRTRAWVANDLASVYAIHGRLEQALPLAQQALALKQQVVGPEHPDVALGCSNLCTILTDVGRPAEGIPYADRAIAILKKTADPNDPVLSNAMVNKGEALFALGQYGRALASFQQALANLTQQAGAPGPTLAGGLSGVGKTKLALGDPRDAVAPLERANEIYDRFEGAGTTGADTRFAFARALWDGGGERRRAVRLAESAREAYAKLDQQKRVTTIAEWLAAHRLAAR